MQLKLLNFYKLLSNIATNLVGAFIPLIVLQATGSVAAGAISLSALFLIRMVTTFVFKKAFFEKPQLILMLRLIPMILYSVFILIIDTNLWVGVIGACCFYGVSEAFKKIPTEGIFNYATINGAEKTLGASRLFEQLGLLIALVVGGFLLDIDRKMVILVSILIYLISVVPLVVFYFKSKNDATFNKDAVSNALITFKEKNEKLYFKGKSIIKNILIWYGITYFVFCFLDALTAVFNIHLFIVDGSFGTAGLFNAAINATFGIGSYLFGFIDSKYDTTKLIIVSCVVCAIGVGLLAVVGTKATWLLYLIFAVIGVFYAFICSYVLQRMLSKTRILGVSNEALFIRENTSNCSVILPALFGVFGTMIPVFVVISIATAISAWLVAYNEEKTRKLLVDYLQYNEIVSNKHIQAEENYET